MAALLGNIFRISMIACLLFGAVACNFFGKKEDNGGAASPPGTLGNGTSIVGTWAFDVSDTSSSDNPGSALTFTYQFDPAGGFRLTAADLHSSGFSCTAYGQYRSGGGSAFTLYVQAVSPSNCNFGTPIQMNGVQVFSRSLRYTDGATNQTVNLYADNAQANAPVGVWDFHHAGAPAGSTDGGIDYILMDNHGYFILQTSSGGQQYLILGFYSIANGGITYTFFANFDPSQTTGGQLQFNQFVTDGTVLQLSALNSNGTTTTFTGNKL